MNLFIIRHTEAEYLPTGPGGERQITPEGKLLFQSSVQNILSSFKDLDLIISSPALRTKQTMEILVESLGFSVKTELAKELMSGSPVADMYHLINSYKKENVAVVMHEPEASLLLVNAAGTGALDVYFKPGTIAKVAFPGKMRPHTGRIHFLVPPDLFIK